MSEVSDLLARSLAIHEQAKPLWSGTGPNRRRLRDRDWVKLAEACELRQRAHALDPEHTDQAWKDEQGRTAFGVDTHKVLMDFYHQGADG